MTTLTEIEAAAENLPSIQQQELLLFLAANLRRAGDLPPPRDFSREQIERWIAEDEEGMRRLLDQA